MAVKIRLTRTGSRNSPSYRLVAADSRSPRDGRFIEILGHYDPGHYPESVTVKEDRVLHWLRNGATATATVKKLLKEKGISASTRKTE
ncbi:MAG: 30S ribosomal protein S16 [bacterium]